MCIRDRLKDVRFGYSPLEPPLIEGFDLNVNKGGCVEITGGSGSGKSTVAKIIAGLYGEQGGVVTFNGAARNELDRHYFYSHIASVSQNIRLFEGTVLDNITMWDTDIPVSYTHLRYTCTFSGCSSQSPRRVMSCCLKLWRS